MNNNSIKQLTEAFLRWPLPKSVRSDECATIRQEGRIGTNLMTYVEAEKMFTDIVGPTLAENAALREAISTQSSLLKRWLELAEEQSETLDLMTYTEFKKKDGLVGDTHSVLNTLNEDTKS